MCLGTGGRLQAEAPTGGKGQKVGALRLRAGNRESFLQMCGRWILRFGKITQANFVEDGVELNGYKQGIILEAYCHSPSKTRSLN